MQQGGWHQVGQGQHQQQQGRGAQQQVQWLPKLKCQHCTYETNLQNELEFHKETMHQQGYARNWCYRCNVEVTWENTSKKHICRMPNHDSENTCNFCKVELFSSDAKENHICEQHPFKTVSQQEREKSRMDIECTNGAGCWKAKHNKCWFRHSQQVIILPHQEQVQRQDARTRSGRPQLYCMYQEQCFKGSQICRFKHVNQVFQENNQSQRNH